MAHSSPPGKRLFSSSSPLDIDLNPAPLPRGVKRAYSPNDYQHRPLKLPLISHQVVRDPSRSFSSSPPRVAQPRFFPDSIQASKIIEHGGKPGEKSEYTQRKLLHSTPGPSQNPDLSLRSPRYNLPQRLVDNLEEMGINSIYPWQRSCLMKQDVWSGARNLVYQAPTGGGKSLVADLLMIKRVIEHPTQKAMLVLPYNATVQEKLLWLRRALKGIRRNELPVISSSEGTQRPRKVLKNEDIQITGFFGGAVGRASWEETDIAVCTIEKANSLINAMLIGGSMTELRVLVLDELHMINDTDRGHYLEMMTTKILCTESPVQVIGLSATFTDIEVIARWLHNATFLKTNYRPIPIEEFFVSGSEIYPMAALPAVVKASTSLPKNGNIDGSSQPMKQIYSNHPKPCKRVAKSESKALSSEALNSVVALAFETVRDGYGVLVFCGTRRSAVATSKIISQVLPEEVTEEELEGRKELLSDLQQLSSGYEDAFDETVMRGVGIHHAGLTFEERKLVAEAFDKKHLRVIVATASLAAGVNLPARRVIIYGARMGRDMIGPSMLRQMRGRAGRKGKDEMGESYICFEAKDSADVYDLLEAELPELVSALAPQKQGLNRSLLEIISTGLARSHEDISSYVSCSLLASTTPLEALPQRIDSSLGALIQKGYIIERVDDFDETKLYHNATQLGDATVAAFLDPDQGLLVDEDCRRSLQSFCLDSELHIFYLFTPLQDYEMTMGKWKVFLQEIEKLNSSDAKALMQIGINPGLVARYSNQGEPKTRTSKAAQWTSRIHHRFYIALQLRDLCNEKPIHEVAQYYQVDRGHVQDLAKNCHSFAWGLTKFCEKMGWTMLQVLLEHMISRLITGSKADLLDLARIPYVKSATARIFWENNYKTVRHVAGADIDDLIPLLIQAQPRKYKFKSGDEERRLRKLQMKATVITERARSLWDQEVYVELDE